MFVTLACLLIAAEPADWEKAEAAHLANIKQVTSGFVRAGEGYFSPDGKQIIFASSHNDPDAKKKQDEEYKQREEDRKAGVRRNYRWDFDPHMAIFEANPDGTSLKRLTDGKGYHAEGSYSADGKQIVCCANRDDEKSFELYIMDADGQHVRKLTNAPN